MANQDPEGVRDWFRSDDVEYISIMLQEFCAHKVLSRLGRLGVVQFTDLNPTQTVFQRRYVREVQRCDNIEQKLRYFDEQMEKYEVPPHPKPDVEAFLNRLEQRSTERADRTGSGGGGGGGGGDQVNYMDRVEFHVEEKEAELVQLNRYNATLTADYHSQLELRSVLEKARNYAAENGSSVAFEARGAPVDRDQETGGGGYDESIRFRFIAGVCNHENRSKFERMVFRSTRGNCLMRFYDIDEPMEDIETGEKVLKDVFFIFFQSQIIQEKIKRIAEAFQARLYQIPDLSDIQAIDERASDVHNDIADRRRVLEKNQSDIVLLLSEAASYVEVWKWLFLREKSIYHTMNHFSSDVEGVLRAEGWVLSAKKEEVVQIVASTHQEMGDANRSLPSYVKTLPKSQWPSSPPTYNKVNRFTKVYQVIVDTYGVSRYQEANPALMSVITFPFAFGVMFGDIGHGSLLFLFFLYVVLNEKKFEKIFSGDLGILFGGRYLLLLMGFFSTYCGFIYNDFFAMGLLLWPTEWNQVNTNGTTIYFEPKGGVYPFGVDPTWHRATNDLLFLNSLKMKMSVIFGITQMTVGLIHRAQNAVFFNKRGLMHNLDLWFEAVPMIVFMMSLFGYMCFMILYKWSVQWVWDGCRIIPGEGATAPGCDRTNCCNPPALITQLINIVLSVGSVPKDEQLYEGQGSVQAILLLIAVIMVPLMLVPKPYFEIQRMKAAHGQHPAAPSGHVRMSGEHTELMLGDSSTSIAHPDDHEDEIPHEEHGVGDIIIHQCIETIEFTLGCISNTASYLRLWALSLAHSQLASVFLEKALLDFIVKGGVGGVFMTFIGYAVFASITFAVLMLMDNLECFLHALRLHWVEFQNKFFRGDGVAFAPLYFHSVLCPE